MSGEVLFYICLGALGLYMVLSHLEEYRNQELSAKSRDLDVLAKAFDSLGHKTHLIDQRVDVLIKQMDGYTMSIKKDGAMDLKEYLDQQLEFAHRDWQALVSRADDIKRGMGTVRYNRECEAVQQRIGLLSKHKSMYCLMTSADP